MIEFGSTSVLAARNLSFSGFDPRLYLSIVSVSTTAAVTDHVPTRFNVFCLVSQQRRRPQPTAPNRSNQQTEYWWNRRLNQSTCINIREMTPVCNAPSGRKLTATTMEGENVVSRQLYGFSRLRSIKKATVSEIVSEALRFSLLSGNDGNAVAFFDVTKFGSLEYCLECSRIQRI